MGHKSWAHHSFNIHDTPEGRAAYVVAQVQFAEGHDRARSLEAMRASPPLPRLGAGDLWDWLPSPLSVESVDGQMLADHLWCIENFGESAYSVWRLSRLG